MGSQLRRNGGYVISAKVYVRYAWIAREALANALYDAAWLEQVSAKHTIPAAILRANLHTQRLAFLNFLAQTQFPTLLAWRLPNLAGCLFQLSHTKTILNPKLQNDYKFIKQASRVCFGYAVASLSRLAPRQLWVGQGFATLNQQTNPTRISDEILHIEPDLGQLTRQFPMLAQTPLEAGETGWSWLEKALRTQGLNKAAAWAKAHHTCWQDLTLNHWSAHLTLQQHLNQSWQALGLTPQLQWWSTRLAKPLHISWDLLQPILMEVSKQQIPYRTENAGAPLVWRIAQQNPAAIQSTAEEFWEWIIDAKHGQAYKTHFNPIEVQHSQLLIQFRQQQHRILGCDPSPLRSTNRAQLLLNQRPQSTLKPLQLPSTLIDNRLMRPRQHEYTLSGLSKTDEAICASPLMHEKLMPLVRRELASPRYRYAPDLLPLSYDFLGGTDLKFGILSACGNCLVLKANTLEHLVKYAANSLGLARWLNQINHALFQTNWWELVIDGKPCCLYSASHLSLDWLFSKLQRTEQNVIIRIAQDTLATSPIYNQSGALDALLMCPSELLQTIDSPTTH